MKLNVKLFIPLLALGLLMETYLGLIWYPAQIYQAQQRALARLEDHLNSLERTLLLPVLDMDFAAIYAILDSALADNPHWQSILLHDQDDQLLYPLSPQYPEETTFVELRHPVAYLDQPVAVLSLRVNLDSELATESSRLMQLLWLSLLAVLVFISVVGLIVEVLVRRPLGALANAADRLAAQDFDAPLPVANRDEVGRMIRSFSTMRNSLRDSQQQLRQQLEAQQQAEAALRRSHRRYRSLYDDTPAMFLTVDPDGTILSVNRFGAAQLHYGVDELGGLSLATLYGPKDWQQVQQYLQACLATPNTLQRWELPRVRKDGSSLWVRETARPAEDHSNTTILIVSEDITEAHELAVQLRHQASHDALTDLYNRREFENRVTAALRRAQTAQHCHALCYLDLDQFKIINDTSGHIAGDELLRQVARLIQQRIRQHDTLARLGGDEFGILLEHCNLEQAEHIANGICHTLEQFRFFWEDKSFRIGASIGVVAIDANSSSLNSLLRTADTACYVAKDLGRNRSHVHHPDDTALAERHQEMNWVGRIERALEENRFQLWYQPIVAAGDKPSPLHYEVLLRLKEADGKLIPPGVFLSAAERYQLSPRIDRWVIQQLLRWLEQHPAHLTELGRCSINLSGISVGDEKFHRFVLEQLSRSRVPTHKLCFEITETAAIANLAAATHLIQALHQGGCYFALDDFGSGLSSFAYLKHLPVDFLKIDGMFVRDITRNPIDKAMVTAIHQIGTTMGKQTVAEFVEDQATQECLESIGVNYLQGYHLGRPQPLEQLLTPHITA